MEKRQFSRLQFLAPWLGIFLFLSAPNPASAQKSLRPDYIADHLGLGGLLDRGVFVDSDTLRKRIDSLQTAMALDSTDTLWLNLELFRAIATLNEQKIGDAENILNYLWRQTASNPKGFLHRNVMINYGSLFHLKENFKVGENTLNCWLGAMELAAEAGDKQMEFDLAVQMGDVHIDLKQRKEAWEWLDRAASILPEIWDPVNCTFFSVTAADASNPQTQDELGRLKWESKEAEAKAFEYINQAISCGEQVLENGNQDQVILGLVYHIRADFWRTPEEQVFYFKKSRANEEGYPPIVLAQTYSRLGDAYTTANQLDSAIIYLDSSRTAYASTFQLPTRFPGLLAGYIRYYKAVGNEPDSLIKYLSLYNETNVAAVESEYKLELDKNKSKFQDAQQKLTILEQQSELDDRARRTRNLFLLIAVLALISLLILVFLLRIRKRNKIIRRKNQEIEGMVKQLEKNLAEKETLVHEVNHRVKNNLQMITAFVDMEARSLPAGEATSFADGIRKRIRAVSLVHELIIEGDRLLGMNFKDYALELVRELESLHSHEGGLEYHADFAEIKLGLSPTMYLGVLLNELISNSMKHAVREGETLKIWIKMEKRGGDLNLSYRDSGGGIKEQDKGIKRRTKSIGMLLIRSMARQLDGEMIYEAENGGRYVLTFPEPELEI